MFTLVNMETPLRASMRATSWGVETMTAPAVSVQPVDSLTIHEDQLTEAELHVAGTRRHVNDKHVQLALVACPVHIEEHLLDGLLHHKATPHNRSVRVRRCCQIRLQN